MSWIKAAVNAMNNGPEAKFTRTVRQVANTVAKQAGLAVSEGSRLLQDRPNHPELARYLKGFRETVKELDELSVSCRGAERVLLLRRWLVALKEVERVTKGVVTEDNGDYNQGDSNSKIDAHNHSDEEVMYDEPIDPPQKPTLVYYYEPDMGTEPMNFRDVFLGSKALEGLTVSLIHEAPKEEEVSILMEIFRLCLTGGKEVHRALLHKIQDLAKVFSTHQDELLVKRDELLGYAQSAIAGLKINADIERIDSEARSMKETLDSMKTFELPTKSSEGTSVATIEAIKEARMQIRLLFELKDLLLRKKSLRNGDSPQLHAEKVDKLKILSESLMNSTEKAETRIIDQRCQKDDAVKTCVAKTEEVINIEKDLLVEITELEKQRSELEDRLKEVNILLDSARERLHNAREAKEQHDNASSEIITHMELKEDELVSSVDSCKAEADVVNAWIQFMEDAWDFQSSYTDHKEKQIIGDLERYGEYFVKLVIHLLSSYKEELGPSITQHREIVKNLRANQGEVAQSINDESSEAMDSRKILEEEYEQSKAKLRTTFSLVDSMKKRFYSQSEGNFRRDDKRVEELFQSVQKIKEEFESIESPTFESSSGNTELESSGSKLMSEDDSTEEVDNVPHSDPKTVETSSVSVPESSLSKDTELSGSGLETGNKVSAKVPEPEHEVTNPSSSDTKVPESEKSSS